MSLYSGRRRKLTARIRRLDWNCVGFACHLYQLRPVRNLFFPSRDWLAGPSWSFLTCQISLQSSHWKKSACAEYRRMAKDRIRKEAQHGHNVRAEAMNRPILRVAGAAT